MNNIKVTTTMLTVTNIHIDKLDSGCINSVIYNKGTADVFHCIKIESKNTEIKLFLSDDQSKKILIKAIESTMKTEEV